MKLPYYGSTNLNLCQILISSHSIHWNLWFEINLIIRQKNSMTGYLLNKQLTNSLTDRLFSEVQNLYLSVQTLRFAEGENPYSALKVLLKCDRLLKPQSKATWLMVLLPVCNILLALFSRLSVSHFPGEV
jgi:hypothetical protein